MLMLLQFLSGQAEKMAKSSVSVQYLINSLIETLAFMWHLRVFRVNPVHTTALSRSWI